LVLNAETSPRPTAGLHEPHEAVVVGALIAIK